MKTITIADLFCGAGGTSTGAVQAAQKMIRSVSESQEEILDSIERLHCLDGFDCDLTFGNGCFWKNRPRPLRCFDITPLHEGVEKASSVSTPLDSESVGSVVFDPPFLTYVKNGRGHKSGRVAMTARFGGYYSYSELESHYRCTLKECARILRNKGKLVFKCQDIIHNHRMHCTHSNVIEWAKIECFRLVDLFVLTAKHRMPGPQKGVQRHARIWHSYFLVFEKCSGVFSKRFPLINSKIGSPVNVD